MPVPESNASLIDHEELKQSIIRKIYEEGQSEVNRKNFRAALAGEIMATLAGAIYTANEGWARQVPWKVAAEDAIEAADALIAKLEEK